MNCDVIIIGAGLGGLTAGAKLAKEGNKVLVLEQHDRPGGCATTFKRRDFTMEVGLHEMDGLHPRDIKTRIFRDLGISGRVEFLELPEFYRFFNGRVDIVIPHQAEKAMKVLKERFPAEGKGIDTYFDHVLNARRITGGQETGKDRSVGEFLDGIISDEDLKLVLLGNLGYFHDDPYSLSLFYYLNAQGSYYAGRANFIRGGSRSLTEALASIIEENQGAVHLNSMVTSIDYDGKKPAGVTWERYRGKDRGVFSEKAPEIIMNGAVPNLVEGLLSPEDGKALSEKIGENRLGASLLTVYFGFNRPLKEIHNHYSTFVFDESVRRLADILPNNRGDFASRGFTLVDYSQVDSDLAPEGKSVGTACCIDYPSDWEGLDREEYDRLKSDVSDSIIERCEKFIPGFRDSLEYVEVGTSLTIRRFTLNPQGAVYGFAQNPGKPDSYLSALPENVHIASAWGRFGGGFSGAIISGYMTALDLLRKKS